MPRPRHPNPLKDAAPLRPNPSEVAVLSDASGYIRFIDKRRLVATAKHYHVSIRVLRRVGHFVPAGIPLMMVSKGNRLPSEETAELLAAFDIGPTRTLQQDVEFGVLQIVDVALKAISPAVNDPTTAINCVDQLSRILIHFASREPPEELLYDPPGIVRASIRWIHFERLLEQPLSGSACMRRRTWRLACGCCEPLVTLLLRRPIRSSAGYLSSTECGRWQAAPKSSEKKR